MNDNYDIACLMNKVIYLIGTLATIIASFIFDSLPFWLCIVLLVCFCISIIRQVFKRKSMVRDKYGDKKYVYFYMLLAILMTYAFRSQHMFFVVLYVSGVSCFMFMKPQISKLQIRYTIILLAMGVIINFPGIPHKYSLLEYFVSAVAVLGILWMELIMVEYIVFQNRENIEQERSLDDFLKVIEVKCDEARQATKSKSEFLSNMSHEIRTPINAVLGMNEMILRESSDKNILKYAANVESAGKMLLSLINDVLDFSKIESGRMEIIPVEYQLSSVLNDLVNMIKPRIEKKGLELKLQINNEIPNHLMGDEVRIRQIVTNILTNAVKYTDSGSVTLIADYKETTQDSMQLYLAVKDTGRGIKEEDKNRLFESFQRVDEKKNRSIEGTGLGLSITKCFTEMMNGTIGVESQYGEGSLFYVYIPQNIVNKTPVGDFKKQFETSLAEREHYHESFTAPDAHILVVDDNEMNLEVVTGLLKQTKVLIDKATSGHECLQALRKNKYDIVLLDHMMPDMDGVETLEHMKVEKLAEGIPIIALTANAVSGAREMYMEYGFWDYLSKPIVGSALEKILYKWLPKNLIHNTKKEEEETLPTKIVWPVQMNTDQALKYSINGEDGILFNVSLYLRSVEKTRNALTEYFENKNYKEYIVYAHSLKSTSATIGLMELSELAKKLELAGKQGDFEMIEKHHKELLDMYDEIVNHLKLLPKSEM